MEQIYYWWILIKNAIWGSVWLIIYFGAFLLFTYLFITQLLVLFSKKFKDLQDREFKWTFKSSFKQIFVILLYGCTSAFIGFLIISDFLKVID